MSGNRRRKMQVHRQFPAIRAAGCGLTDFLGNGGLSRRCNPDCDEALPCQRRLISRSPGGRQFVHRNAKAESTTGWEGLHLEMVSEFTGSSAKQYGFGTILRDWARWRERELLFP